MNIFFKSTLPVIFLTLASPVKAEDLKLCQAAAEFSNGFATKLMSTVPAALSCTEAFSKFVKEQEKQLSSSNSKKAVDFVATLQEMNFDGSQAEQPLFVRVAQRGNHHMMSMSQSPNFPAAKL